MNRSLILSVLFLFLGLTAFSQQTPMVFLVGKVENKVTGQSMSGVRVEVRKNGQVVTSTTTSGNGKYKMSPFPIGEKYEIHFIKEGFLTRYLVFDLTGIPPEHQYPNGYDLPADMTMVEKMPDINYGSLPSTPTGEFKYQKKKEDVDWDFSVTTVYNKQLDQIIAQIEAKKKVEEANEKKFKDVMAQGDAAMGKSDFENAVKKYEEATKLKPSDTNAQSKLADAKKKYEDFKNNQDKEKQYKDLMAEADKAFSSKDYAFAKSKYKEALNIKPNEKIPQDKIKEIDGLIAAQMAADQKYQEFLAKGNQSMLNKGWDDAIKNFEEAIKLKPNEQEPKDLLAQAKKGKEDASKAEADAKKKEEEFNALVKKGDGELTASKFDDAISSYESALKIKDDAGVKAKIEQAKAKKKEAEDLAAKKDEEAKKQKEYDEMIKKADGELAAKEFDKSIGTYEAALIIKPTEKYPEDQIAKAKALKAEAEKLAAEQAEKEKKEKEYNDLIASADAAFQGSKWQESINKYEAALKLKPTEKYPVSQIDKAKAQIAEEAKNAELIQKYNDLIKKADAEFNNKQWDKAIVIYQEAANLRNTEQYPVDQIEKAKEFKQDEANAAAEAAKKEAEFKDLVARADKDLAAAKYDDAISKYEQALAIKKDTYASDQLAKAKAAKKAAEEAMAESERKEKEYQDLIAKADGELSAMEYNKAIVNYEAAIKLKPAEKYPQEQLAKAKRLKEEAEKDAAAKAEAEKKQKEYDALIASADDLFNNKKWDDAIKKYEAAKLVLPNEKYPVDRISEAKSNKAKEEADKANAAQREAKYKEVVAKADNEFNAGNFRNSIDLYKEALSFKENDAHATDRIRLAEERIKEREAELKKQYDLILAQADKDFAAGNFEDAKSYYERAIKMNSSDQYPKDKLKETEEAIRKKSEEAAATAERQKKYNEFIKLADADFSASKWTSAISFYEKALTFKDEQYPKDQISKAQAKLKEQENAEELNKRYKEIVKEADAFMASKDYDGAENKYKEALGIKSSEKYPQDQINKIADIRKMQAEATQLEENYRKLIDQADNEMESTKFDASIATYSEALKIKPKEKYPQEQIEKAKRLKAEAEKDAQANAAKEAKYKEVVAKADNEFNAGSFRNSIDLYNEALTYKPGDQHSTDRIASAEQRLKEREDQLNHQYQLIIQQADKDFAASKWDDAKGYYERALKFKPNEQYPKDQLAEIEKRRQSEADQAAKRKQYDELIAKADADLKKNEFNKAIAGYEASLLLFPNESYPLAQISEAKRLKEEFEKNQGAEKRYQEIITRANSEFDAGAFEGSITLYEEALTVKPGDKFAMERIVQARKRMEERKAEMEKQYQLIIQQADKDFASKNYADAKSYYERALKFKPKENYPKEQIYKIQQLLEEAGKANLAAKNYNGLINQANSNFDTQNYLKAKELYQKASEIKPEMPFPAQRIKEIDDILKKQREEKEAADLAAKQKEALNNPRTKESYYGNPINISIDEALKMMQKKNIDDQQKNNDKYKEITAKRDDFIQDLSSEQDQTRLKNDQKFTEEKEKMIVVGAEGEKIRVNNISEFKQIFQEKYDLNEGLSKDNERKLLDKHNEFVQQIIQAEYDAVGQDKLRQENIAEMKDVHQNRNDFNEALAGDSERKILDEKKRIEEEDILLQESLWAMDILRQKNTQNIKNITDQRNEFNEGLAGESERKIVDEKKRLDDENIKLEEAIASHDVIRQIKTSNINELKENRTEVNEQLAGDYERRILDEKKRLEEDNIKLEESLAAHDVIRQQKEADLSDFKKVRYETNEMLAGDFEKRIFEEKKRLDEDNIQLEESLAAQDKIRQEKTADINELKENRTEVNETLAGDYEKKIFEEKRRLDEDNIKLEESLAAHDEIRQQKEAELSDFKKDRDEFNETLASNSEQKILDKKKQLTEDDIKLQEAIAAKDGIRQVKEKDLAEFKESRENTEADNATLQGNKVNRVNQDFDKTEGEVAAKHSEMAKTPDKNVKELKELENQRIQAEEEMIALTDLNRTKSQENLEVQKTKDYDPRPDESFLMGEKQFQKTDAAGQPTEITIQRLVKKGNTVYEYLMIINRNGPTYFKNGQPISETQWSVETGVPKE